MTTVLDFWEAVGPHEIRTHIHRLAREAGEWSAQTAQSPGFSQQLVSRPNYTLYISFSARDGFCNFSGEMLTSSWNSKLLVHKSLTGLLFL